jgi:FkbH-like protein
MAKLPFAQRCVPIYAEHCARLCGALLGKARKCLVLDLDNTLWGGVIGDDGIEGIVLGQGSAVGEAFLAVQQMAIDLRERGVVLAVSSKNNDNVARAVFKDHPDMLIREEHIAVFQANWKDKASNLEAIAQTLNIGIDALVLVDDNPAERAQVRQALPQVAVPELGDDPSLYPRHVFAAGYFEAVAFSAEDRQRAEQYQANAKRVSMQGQARDLKSYLKSLNMVMKVTPFDSVGRARISQLINKSNQFNLTTKRYTEAAVARLEGDADALTFQIRLSDAFGDNGMICVVILERHETDWEIDTWLMSCRVLGRQVEEATLNTIVAAAKQAGGRRLIGTYRPTDRNQMVADHYKKLGFSPVESREDRTTIWALDIASYEPKEVQIHITSGGDQPAPAAVATSQA